MNPQKNTFPQVTDRYRLLRRCRRRMAELDATLHALGITLWQTDLSLRLTDSHGMEVAESYHGRSLSEFYREAYGLDPSDPEPIQSHHDASAGESVTMHCHHRGGQYLIMVEPKRNEQGEIIGTLGMSLRLGSLATSPE